MGWRTIGNDLDRGFIMSGIRNGFCITEPGSSFQEAACRNYSSVTDTYQNLVEEQIYQEVVLGQYRITRQKPNCQQPIGAILNQGGGSS